MLVAMMLLTVSDVFLRYAFRRPIFGSTEITEIMIVMLGFLGLAWCAVKGGHLKVDLLMSRFSPRLQAIFDSFTYFAGLVICIIIAWRSLLESIAVKKLDIVSFTLKFQNSIFFQKLNYFYFLFYINRMLLIQKRIEWNINILFIITKTLN